MGSKPSVLCGMGMGMGWKGEKEARKRDAMSVVVDKRRER